jgi:hypothetical protein
MAHEGNVLAARVQEICCRAFATFLALFISDNSSDKYIPINGVLELMLFFFTE